MLTVFGPMRDRLRCLWAYDNVLYATPFQTFGYFGSKDIGTIGYLLNFGSGSLFGFINLTTSRDVVSGVSSSLGLSPPHTSTTKREVPSLTHRQTDKCFPERERDKSQWRL